MKIWHISDTYTLHEQLEVPNNIDLVIHSGDESNSSDPYENQLEFYRFIDWYRALDIKHKIFVGGNHSTALQKFPYCKEDLVKNGIIYLENSSCVIDGRKIYGSPWTPAYGKSWAFMRKRGKLSPIWDMIPMDTDILVTHGPPKGKLDLTMDRKGTKGLVRVGCKELLNRVREVSPSHHMFGHIHSDKNDIKNFATLKSENINFMNSSSCSFEKGEFNHGQVIYV